MLHSPSIYVFKNVYETMYLIPQRVLFTWNRNTKQLVNALKLLAANRDVTQLSTQLHLKYVTKLSEFEF